MKVVIAGGGFGGLKLARRLGNKEGIEVVLVDRVNYHQFQPLFYQVATAGLDASNISFPFRKAFQGLKNVRFELASLKTVDAAGKKIITDAGEIAYDILVLSTGADTNFFGNKELAENAFPMKSTVEALQIRNRLIQNFEEAASSDDPETKKRLLTLVLVGGGPTGVELSGAVAELKLYILPKDYPELDFSQMKIFLLEGSPKTLGAMSESSAKQSRQYLEKMGVTVKTETVVKNYDGKEVVLQNGEVIQAGMVIWAAGIRGNVPAGIDPALTVKGNRIMTDRYNRVKGQQDVYAIGDVAAMETPLYPHGHPQVAAVAIQQAARLAKNIQLMKKGETTLTEFEYFDKGSMATVGRNKAVVDIPKPKIHFKGLLAWLVWMSLHLMLILGVKNRLFVFLNWLYNYFTHDQSLRLLLRDTYRAKKVNSD